MNTMNTINKLSLKKCYDEDNSIFEIGVDEVGRGPLFGRVYTGAVILPKDDIFDFSKMKDSKKFSSKKKIKEVSNYIKANAVAWNISYEDEKKIDEINILQATQTSMHKSIRCIVGDMERDTTIASKYCLLIDGNYFVPFTYLNKQTSRIESLPFVTVKGGDNTYASIAAASILAKVERDEYIEAMCNENPELIEKYGIDSNKGYGAKRHLDGIKEHGITEWHRKSFAPCKYYV